MPKVLRLSDAKSRPPPKQRTFTSHGGRLQVDVLYDPSEKSALPEDVRRGLTGHPKQLPPKYFYDAVGSTLFDRICDTPEYYPTRTEWALLDQTSDRIIDSVSPTDIIELGSGAARKTQCLLDAAHRARLRTRYVPFDVSESMLVESAHRLLDLYPWLSMHGIVGDYTRHLDAVPHGGRRLILFIGSTLGNFDEGEAVVFLENVAQHMGEHDRLLLGVDLVKDPEILDAAYNDSEGLTAAFNKNVLSVINRELGARFDPEQFDHIAFYAPEKEQVEMHLMARERHSVDLIALEETVTFEEGETILTEISRKFRRETLSELLAFAGLEILEWHTPENEYFALSLCRRSR